MARSLAWYQHLLGIAATTPAHDYFAQLLDAEPQRNPGTGTMEFALRDLDGYHVVLSALA